MAPMPISIPLSIDRKSWRRRGNLMVVHVYENLLALLCN